jgi:S1-C subfamily serine protease
MILRRITFVAFVCLFATGPVNAKAANREPLPELVNHVKRAVVVVKSFDGRGRLASQGSGFFVAPNRIVTNLHVVGTANRVVVETFCGRTFAVEGVRAYDRRHDLALLQAAVPATFETSILEVARIATVPGEPVFVVSNPKGAPWQVSRGLTMASWDFQEFGVMIPLTASLSRGSSGGPVVNLQGRVIGIATMSLTRTKEYNFAIPAECATALRPSFLQTFPLLPGE